MHHPAQLERKTLESAYIGLLADNRRLKAKARAHKRNIRTMQSRLQLTRLELNLLRAQLESGIVHVDKPWAIKGGDYHVISPTERMSA